MEDRLHHSQRSAVQLIAKLEWAKMGESERQLRDASGIVEIQGENLDLSYVERWVTALSLEEQWERAKALAGLAPRNPTDN